MLSFDQVKNILDSELDPRIKAARAMKDKLRLHVDGIGLQEYLSRINNYENAGQFTARQKHAISNKFLTEELLRPVDNAFHARGGSKNYQFSSDQEKKEIEISKRRAAEKGSSITSGAKVGVCCENVKEIGAIQDMEIKSEVKSALNSKWQPLSCFASSAT